MWAGACGTEAVVLLVHVHDCACAGVVCAYCHLFRARAVYLAQKRHHQRLLAGARRAVKQGVWEVPRHHLGKGEGRDRGGSEGGSEQLRSARTRTDGSPAARATRVSAHGPRCPDEAASVTRVQPAGRTSFFRLSATSLWITNLSKVLGRYCGASKQGMQFKHRCRRRTGWQRAPGARKGRGRTQIADHLVHPQHLGDCSPTRKHETKGGERTAKSVCMLSRAALCGLLLSSLARTKCCAGPAPGRRINTRRYASSPAIIAPSINNYGLVIFTNIPALPP